MSTSLSAANCHIAQKSPGRSAGAPMVTSLPPAKTARAVTRMRRSSRIPGSEASATGMKPPKRRAHTSRHGCQWRTSSSDFSTASCTGQVSAVDEMKFFRCFLPPYLFRKQLVLPFSGPFLVQVWPEESPGQRMWLWMCLPPQDRVVAGLGL